MSVRINVSAAEARSTSVLETTPLDLQQMAQTEEFRLWFATQQNDGTTIHDRFALPDSAIGSQTPDNFQIVELPSRVFSFRRLNRFPSRVMDHFYIEVSVSEDQTSWVMDQIHIETSFGEDDRTDWGAGQSDVSTLVGEADEPDWMPVFDSWKDGEEKFAAEMNKTLVWKPRYTVRACSTFPARAYR